MKQFFIYIVLFFLPALGFAQPNAIQGKTVNEKEEVIPYATIVSKSYRIGTYSDAEGNFSLEYKSIKDTIIIKALGHHELSTTIENIINNNYVVLLKTKEYLLNETRVSPVNLKNASTTRIGYLNYKLRGTYIAGPGYQIAVKISNSLQNAYIDKVYFRLKKEGNCHLPIRLRLLEPDSNGIPGKDLIEENIIIPVKDMKRKMQVDVSEYQVKIPVPFVFVVIEWLDNIAGCENKKTTWSGTKYVSPTLKGNLDLNEGVTWGSFRGKKWGQFYKNGDENINTPNIGLSLKIPDAANN